MKNIYLTILLALFLNAGFSQNAKIDSLKKILSVPPTDTSQMKILNDLGWLFITINEFDSAMHYQNKVLAIAEKLLPIVKEPLFRAVKREKGRAYSRIGIIYFKQGNYPEALEKHNICLKILKEIRHNPASIANTYNSIGAVYSDQGNYEKAIKNYLEALKIKKATNDQHGIGMCYSNIGVLYRRERKYEEALKYLFEGLKISNTSGNQDLTANCYLNIGAVYGDWRQYKEALSYYLLSLKIREVINDKNGMASCFINIGGCYSELGQYDLSMKNYLNALRIKNELGVISEVSVIYTNIGLLYNHMKQPVSAITYVKKGLEIGLKNEYISDIRLAYHVLSDIYVGQGNFKEGFLHYKNYMLYDSILVNKENTSKTMQAQMNFDFEQKELRLKSEHEKNDLVHHEELKRQKTIGWSAGGFLSLALLTSFLAFNRVRLKQKHQHQKDLNIKQKELAVAVMETQEQERKRIAEDLHDSLGHLLSTAKFNLQALPEEHRPVFENSLHLLNQASSEIHQITFNLMPRTLEEEGLVAALHELVSKITGSGKVKIFLHIQGLDNFPLEKQTQFNIYRIVQEAANNILKHAEAEEINIQLIRQNNHLTIMIEDDGKGFDQSLKRNGRGLKNIQTRSSWLNGNLSIDSTPGRGTTITTEIPV